MAVVAQHPALKLHVRMKTSRQRSLLPLRLRTTGSKNRGDREIYVDSFLGKIGQGRVSWKVCFVQRSIFISGLNHIYCDPIAQRIKPLAISIVVDVAELKSPCM